MTVQESVADTKMVLDQSMLEAWTANVKAMFEQHLRDGEREREQVNDWHALALRTADNNQRIVSRMAEDHASLSTRASNNAATVDHLANVGALAQVTEFRAIGSDVAEQAAQAAKEAINASLGAGAQTEQVANAAIMAQIAEGVADIQRALNVLIVREVAEGSE